MHPTGEWLGRWWAAGRERPSEEESRSRVTAEDITGKRGLNLPVGLPADPPSLARLRVGGSVKEPSKRALPKSRQTPRVARVPMIRRGPLATLAHRTRWPLLSGLEASRKATLTAAGR